MGFLDLYSKYLPTQLGAFLPHYLPIDLPFFFLSVAFLEIAWYLIIINRFFFLPELSLFDFSPLLINDYFYILIY
jgi:hypothetical protein